MSSVEEKAILSLWKSNERKGFGEILKEFNKKRPPNAKVYDRKQVARYLHRLVVKRLLCKYEDNKGRPYYVPAEAPHVREYRLSSHFNRIRSYSLDKGWFIEKDVGRFTVVRVGFYGCPGVDQLTDRSITLFSWLTQQYSI